MEIIHKDYCSRCQVGSADVKYSKGYTKGKVTQYYHCRDCNNKRFKNYYNNNKDRVRSIIYKSIAKHFDKQAARVELCKAIKSGDVLKSDRCEVCFSKENKIEGHHKDYNKPLEVDWLCSSCHSAADKNLRNGV